MSNQFQKDILFFALTLFSCSAGFSQSSLVRTIYFKSNSPAIDKKYEKDLDLVAKQINTDTFGFLKIFGYADKRGSENDNNILSAKRANAVYHYLSGRVKMDSTKVYVASIGKSAEAYDLHFPTAHIQQRCVDIWITFVKNPNVDRNK